MSPELDVQSIVSIQLLSFYGWWQLVVCLFAFLGLMGIWWHIGKKQLDIGQVWLALSVLCWSFSGGVEVLYSKYPEAISTYTLDGWRSIFSLFNSLFILLALPWFRYLPPQIEPLVKSKYWRIIVGLPFLFSLLPTISKMFAGESIGVIAELDVYYAIFTLLFLGLVLWESFAKRRLPILAWLSLVCVLITFAAQVYKLTGSYIDLNLFSAIFKSTLIMIFFALALSWVKELAENIIPEPRQFHLVFERVKEDSGKFVGQVSLNGIPGKTPQIIPLTPALFEVFLAFAERQKTSDGWLEIKPKGDSRTGKSYDIRDYNEVKRLVHALLDGLFGKGRWTKELHELPLRTALFETAASRDRRIRLRIPAENIQVLSR
ncbi:MAG: hypothetical protein KDC34_03150 [Saprospiraceae bacterium]|nr:hypothetical protein [Saprospiraceae bacterium]